MGVLALKVTGRSHRLDVIRRRPCFYVLSDDLALRGPKFGCGLASSYCFTRERVKAALLARA